MKVPGCKFSNFFCNYLGDYFVYRTLLVSWQSTCKPLKTAQHEPKLCSATSQSLWD